MPAAKAREVYTLLQQEERLYTPRVHNGISLVTLKICWDSMYDPQYLPCPPLLPFFVPKREAYEMERVSCLVQTGSPALSFQPQGTRHFYPMGQKRDYLRKSEPFSSSGNTHKRHQVAILQNQQELQPPNEKVTHLTGAAKSNNKQPKKQIPPYCRRQKQFISQLRQLFIPSLIQRFMPPPKKTFHFSVEKKKSVLFSFPKTLTFVHSAESHRENLQYESLCNQNCLHEGKKVASRIKTQERERGLAGRENKCSQHQFNAQLKAIILLNIFKHGFHLDLAA